VKGTIVVIPAFNEARTILSVLSTVCEQDIDGVIAVDDGSKDNTAELIAGFCAQARPGRTLELVRHPANRGKGFALTSGIARAIDAGARRVITIDADGQHCPSDIHRLEQAAMVDASAIVIAARTEAREQAPPLRRFANGVADFWISWACGRRIDDTQSGFRLYPTAVLKSLSTRPRADAGFAFETELLLDCVAAGASVCSVAILTRYQQDSRRSHYRPWRDTWSIIRLVGGKLLRRGMYPAGLFRSLGWLPRRLRKDQIVSLQDGD
jgi:glycosyltransferase involved in cell wall biosynthesis